MPLSGPRAVLDAVTTANRITRVVLGIIEGFLGRVRREVLSGPSGAPPDLSGFPDASVWEPRVRSGLLPELEDLYLGRWEVTADPDAWVRAYLAAVPSRLQTFPAQAFDFVRGVLADGIVAGASPAQLRDRVGAALGIDAPSRVLIDRIARLQELIADEDTSAAGRTRARAALARARADKRAADGTWRWRAARIARTETTGALNAGTVQSLMAQQELDGVLLRVQWWATVHPPASAESAARTRDDHRAAHRQTVTAGRPFTVGGVELAYPGDPAGPAREVVNCRCAVVPV